jgi:hypothetical protein
MTPHRKQFDGFPMSSLDDSYDPDTVRDTDDTGLTGDSCIDDGIDYGELSIDYPDPNTYDSDSDCTDFDTDENCVPCDLSDEGDPLCTGEDSGSVDTPPGLGDDVDRSFSSSIGDDSDSTEMQHNVKFNSKTEYVT